MKTNDDRVRELAGDAHEYIDRRSRLNGEDFNCFRDDAPEWCRDLAMAAHEPGEMFPDDRRYEMLFSALVAISDATDSLEDLCHEWADGEVEIYTRPLLTWLANGGIHWANEAREEGLVADDASIEAQAMAGQYLEATQVYHAILTFLRGRAEEGEDE